MLRFLITVAIIAGLWYVGDAIMGKYRNIQHESGTAPPKTAQTPGSKTAADTPLTGMPASLEPSLQAAQSQGPATLKKWLDSNRRYLQDPKLGDIELEYALLLSRQNFSTAREIYRQVKARTPADSPLQAKLKQLAATYE